MRFSQLNNISIELLKLMLMLHKRLLRLDLLHEYSTLSPRRGNKRKQESLAPFSLGRRVGEGFAPLREEGNSDSRRRSIDADLD